MSAVREVYVGPGSAARCAQAYEARLLARAEHVTLAAVAEQLGCSRSTLRKLCDAHQAMQRYEVKLERAGSSTLPVCTVVTPKGALEAPIAAFREFPGTFKNLELDGWKLVVNGQGFALKTVRASLRRAA